MTYRSVLLLVTCLMLLAFGLRVVSLEAQSMWRDEVDTLCFALSFWEVLQQAAGQHALEDPNAQLNDPAPNRLLCRPAPLVSRVDLSQGFLSALRGLVTLNGWNGPLYTVLMRPWIELTGESPFALRFSSLLFGLLAVPLTYVVGRRLLGTAVGLLGAFLAAMSPHLVWYSQEVKMYAAILTLALLAIYALRRALDRTSRGATWWAVMVVATTLAIYTHVLMALLITLVILLGVIWWPRTRRHWRGALTSLALLTLPYLPLLVWQVRTWLRSPGRGTGLTTVSLDVILQDTYNGWGGNLVGQPWAALVLAGLALLVLSALAWMGITDDGIGREGKGDQFQAGDEETGKGRPPEDWVRRELQTSPGRIAGIFGGGDPARYDDRDIAALLAWMLLPLAGIWLLSARQPLFVNRYLIWAAPAFYLLAAAGCVALGRLGRRGTLVAAGLLLLVLAGDARAILYQGTQPIKPDFRAAAEYLQERYHPGDAIIFHLAYLAQNFDYYYAGDFSGQGAPAAANGSPGPDFDSQMRTNTEGHDTVWLVLSEAEMWDPQGLVKAWLDDHAVTPPEERSFTLVSVYGYRLDR